MKAILVCPALRPAVAGLANRAPLASLPLLGGSPLDAQLSAFYQRGIREVEIIAADRPEEIRAHVGHGEAWGLNIVVTPAASEKAPCDGLLLDGKGGWCDGAFSDYAAWFRTIRAAFANGASRRLGMREQSPEVYVHTRAEVAPDAVLNPPCWIGENTRIGAGTSIGPGVYIEANCTVAEGASIVESWVGPGTYVGAFTNLQDSLAWGNWLCRWSTGATTTVADAFLLGEIPAPPKSKSRNLFPRIFAAVVALLTLIIPAIGALLSLVKKRPLFRRMESVGPDSGLISYYSLPGFRGLLSRWPRLISIFRGDFAWVGNPPISPADAGSLLTEFERLWYSVPPGLISLGDTYGKCEVVDAESCAHASFYAGCRSIRGDSRIIFALFRRAFDSSLARIGKVKPKTHENFPGRSHSPSH